MAVYRVSAKAARHRVARGRHRQARSVGHHLVAARAAADQRRRRPRRCRRASPIRCGCSRANGSSTSSRARTRAARSRRGAAHRGRAGHVAGPAAARLRRRSPARAPIEALVEREQVLAAHPKLNAQAGQQLMRKLRAAGLGAALRSCCERLSGGDQPRRRIRSPTTPASCGTRLLNGKAVDALRARGRRCGRCSATMRRSTRSAPASGIAAAQLATFARRCTRWIAWLDDLALERHDAGREPVLESAAARIRVRAAGRRRGAAAPARRRRVHRRQARLAHLHRQRRPAPAPGRRAARSSSSRSARRCRRSRATPACRPTATGNSRTDESTSACSARRRAISRGSR